MAQNEYRWWLCVLVHLSSATASAGQAQQKAVATPKALLDRVQKAYAAQGDFSAHFSQTYVDKLSGRHRDESGQMWVKADGRVRFAYQVPEPKDFVFDGNQAYFYEPDNAQVTVFEHFADSPVAQAMQFLWGQGDVSRLFAASACPAAHEGSELCPTPAAGETSIQLTPRSPLPTVHHVALVVEVASAQVLRSVVYDPLDNQTRYSFDKLTSNKPIAAKTFAFEIPNGVSVLRAPPMDKPAPDATKPRD